MKSSFATVVGAAMLPLVCLPTLAACNAEARVTNSWIEDGGFLQKANVSYKINSARPGAFVKVYADLQYDYVTTDGTSLRNSGTASVSFDTQHASSSEGVAETTAVNCDKKRPCTLRNVSVREVKCFD